MSQSNNKKDDKKLPEDEIIGDPNEELQEL